MSYYNFALMSNFYKPRDDNCVFISHQKADKEAALEIGKFLMDVVGVHIYLDVIDESLQKATRVENDELIVESVKKGLKYSTHLLCLISNKTRLSWWVPYEIGIADNKNLNIASLKLNTTDNIPSFLKIHPYFYSTEEFIRYAVSYTRYETFSYDRVYPRLFSNANMLKKYIDI